MTQTKTLSFIQQLRAKHQAQAKAAARTGVVPKVFKDDPAFHDLMTTFSEKSSVTACAEK